MKLPDLDELRRRVNAMQERWREVRGSPALALLRPDLPGEPSLSRRLAEPIVLVASLIALATLLALGMSGAALLVLASALAYVIITQVFGLRLELDPSKMGL